ncbi:hypothetical protein ARTHRO9V_160357 [Arthrobacter sp. 9V]|nr:hypothetical protein ARTHRO9V_160357 [Arthrobacter sp. 9V]
MARPVIRLGHFFLECDPPGFLERGPLGATVKRNKAPPGWEEPCGLIKKGFRIAGLPSRRVREPSH